MKFPLIITIAVLCLSVAACSSKKSQDANTEEYSNNRARMEVEAQQMLSTAREFLVKSNFTEAKSTVQKMREKCYLALKARKEGILLMDSIDLATAQHELSVMDSLMRVGIDSITQEDFEEACRKVQFYKQKIQHDKKQDSPNK